MNKLLKICIIFFLLIGFSVPAPAQSGFKKREKNCFDSQQYALVPCPKSGKPMVIEEEEKTPEDEALSFLQELEPYTKLGANGEPLPESAEEWVMVRDNQSGLIWEIKNRDRESISFYAKRLSWKDIREQFIDPLNEEMFGGFSDWRLPTAKELSTLMITSTRVPIVDIDYFPYTRPDSYWTGLFRTDTPDYACHVDFYLGNVHYSPKSQKNYVRAVRMAEGFQERKRVPALREAPREPRGGITDASPKREKTEKTEESERFKEPRRGITDSPPDRERQSVPFRRMPRQ